MNLRIIFSVMSKSAITPSRIGRMALIFPGVFPTIFFASCPTARTRVCPYFSVFTATTEGSFMIIPRPFAITIVFAVPKSIERSFEKSPTILLNIIYIPLCYFLCRFFDVNRFCSIIYHFFSDKDFIAWILRKLIHNIYHILFENSTKSTSTSLAFDRLFSDG